MKTKKVRNFRSTLFTLIISSTFSSVIILAISIYLIYLRNKEVREIFIQIKDLTRLPLWSGYFFIFLTVVSILIIHISNNQMKSFDILKKGIEELSNGQFHTRIKMHKSASEEFNLLAQDFNKLGEELSSIELLRTDFINTFSHEFKTPITSIKGFATLLTSDDLTESERKEYLKIIVSESDRLSRLSKNILVLSKIDTQAITINNKTINLAEQIRLVILKCELLWENKNIKFELDLEEFTFKANSELLEHLFSNLISNAIKFSCDNGEIIITLLKTKDNIHFIIRDYGCGIDKETQKRIFDKFYQEDKSHGTEGNGIGLSIAKSVVEQYNGQINVHSNLNEGTTFEVLLPLKAK